MTATPSGTGSGVDDLLGAAGEEDEFVDSIEQSLAQLFVGVKGALRDAASALGPDVQPAAWTVLRFAMRHQPTQAGAIAAATGMDKSAVSRQLKELRERGLVSIQPDPSDARAVLVTPTEESLRRMAVVTDGWSRRFREVLGEWTEEERRTFAELLERFVGTDPWVRRREP
jgi:DNA-binding MarR family transcriptional regulator